MREIVLVLTCFLLMISATCNNKEVDCYDAQMEQNHSGLCPQDCPGVCGCDGNTYCNECIANSKGISVVSNSPCSN